MSASRLHLAPAALALEQDTPRALLGPADPATPRQLALRPTYVFLQTNFNRRLLDPAPPELAPSAAAGRARPIPFPAQPPGHQARMPLPCAPEGKGKSMGTANLSRAEAAEAENPARRHLPVLPATRGDCLDFRAVTPAPGEKAPKGARGRRLAPCPFVSCRHHLYLDVNPESGAIKVNFPGLERMELAEPWPRPPHRLRVEGGRREYLTFSGPPRQHAVLDLSLMEDTCSLDVGDRGERRHDPLDIRRRQIRLEDVGRKMRLTMERARQLLEHAQGEAEAKATDGQVMRPMAGDDPNDGEGDGT